MERALINFILVPLVYSAMLKIGLTGGIGSGKSTVTQLFENLKVPVIDADIIAHQLVAIGQPALIQIQETFGDTILNRDGSLDRKALREIVFSEPHKKQQLEDIIHPLVYIAIQHEINQLAETPYCIICIPLLFESNMTPLVDRVLVVDCTKEQQIQRLLKRETITLERIHSIIDNQLSSILRNAHANELLDNTESHDRLAEQIKNLHHFYLSLSTC